MYRRGEARVLLSTAKGMRGFPSGLPVPSRGPPGRAGGAEQVFPPLVPDSNSILSEIALEACAIIKTAGAVAAAFHKATGMIRSKGEAARVPEVG